MKQVFCTIHIVCLALKEIIAQAIAHQIKKIHAPENCPTNTQWYISNRMIDEFTKSDDGAFIDNGENVIIRNVEVF